MNFLAHLYLADDTPESMIGNLAADFMKGCRLQDLNPDVQEGVRRHHRVDLFTDSHPVVARSKQRILPAHGRYSGIIVDVFYDHFLASDWDRYSDEPLPRFADRVYDMIESRFDLCPPTLQQAVPRMREQNWLVSYAELEGIRQSLRRISNRLRGDVQLDRAVELLQDLYAPLSEDFLEFFPALIDAIRAQKVNGAE